MNETRLNLPELTVSELSTALRRTIEDAYGYVRVRGELGKVSYHGNGHVYFDLKDDRACIAGVIWRSTALRIALKLEAGLEVVVTGRLTTYPGRSQYQIIVDTLEPAGIGALMALLEERKRKLAAEGLFDEARKQLLPFLPTVIGVVTSPSGAVIRDILHRLADRFPRRVLLWPVKVQGEGSAAEVAAAIEGFNALPEHESSMLPPRPDLIIVARGGGSLEDLWSFNEEIVVRAAAASLIPLISAVGHETDVTLIDFAADRRAPTPTAAAEMAVPVRSELLLDIESLSRRALACWRRNQEARRAELRSASRALPKAEELLALPRQRLDHAAAGLNRALQSNAHAHHVRFSRIAGRLSDPLLRANIERRRERYGSLSLRLRAGLPPILPSIARASARSANGYSLSVNAPDARSGIALRCEHRGPNAAVSSWRHFLIAAYWRGDLLWFAMPIAGRCTVLRRSAWACRLRLNFPMAASRRAPKATRSSGQPLHPVNRAAALSAPDKATCFNFSVSANHLPKSTATR